MKVAGFCEVCDNSLARHLDLHDGEWVQACVKCFLRSAEGLSRPTPRTGLLSPRAH